MARYISLYSGSSGNCSVVEENGKFILIDMGKSARLTNKALTELGLDIKNIAFNAPPAEGEESGDSTRRCSYFPGLVCPKVR